MCRFFQEEPFFLFVRDNSYFILVKIPEPGRDGSRSGGGLDFFNLSTYVRIFPTRASPRVYDTDLTSVPPCGFLPFRFRPQALPSPAAIGARPARRTRNRVRVKISIGHFLSFGRRISSWRVH